MPRTNYVPACSTAEFRKRTPHWNDRPVTEFYRCIYREMVSPTGERTLISAIIPPGPAHIHVNSSVAFENDSDLLDFTGSTHSIVCDFFVKTTGTGHVTKSTAELFPLPRTAFQEAVHSRVLALNCLTSHYAVLWDRNLPKTKNLLPSAKFSDPRCIHWEKAPRRWSEHAPLRTPYSRRQALIELDVLAALSLRMTLEELQLIYRVQFPVLQQYERETYYDRRGKMVFTVSMGFSGARLDRKEWEQIKDAKAGERLPEWAVDAGGAFEPPFDRCDREEDMAQAYAYFKERLGDA